MDGLKYILKEIKARRFLLHDFQKSMDVANSKEFILAPSLSDASKMLPELSKGLQEDFFQERIEDLQKRIKDSKEFTLFSEGVPDFVIKMSPGDKQLHYKVTLEATPVPLTVKDFNTLYKRQFNDLRQCSLINIPLWPNETPPDNYEIFEILGYRLGGGFCSAYLFLQIWSPSMQQPDRQFCVEVEERYVPEQRSCSPKTAALIAITPGAFNWWAQDVEEQAKMHREMKGATLYNWWKQDRRKARPRDYPAEIRISEDTTSDQIWGQLLLSAWGHNYLSKAGEIEAYEELKRYFPPRVLGKIMMHLQKHSFNPYDTKSNMAYLKRLSRLFTMTHNQESGDFLYGDAKKPDDNLSNAVLRCSPKGVFWASLETGIPKRTIYQLIREGKIQVDSSNSEVITLSDAAVDNLKKRANKQNQRKAIFQLAKLKKKSDEAIKKWLQRHRDLPEDKFKNELSLWLGVRQP